MFSKSSALLRVLSVSLKFANSYKLDVMPLKLAANLSMLYLDTNTIAERFELAKSSGFKYVECTFPFAEPVHKLKEAKQKSGVEHILINGYPGNVQNGDRGIAALPDRKEEFREKFYLNIEYAKALNCKRVHVMAGKTDGLDQKQCDETYLENIAYAADQLEKEGIMCMIEPINDRLTIPGYYLTNINKAVDIIKTLNRPNLKLQFDFYHIQLLHGNLTENLKKFYPYIGHIQIAQAPDRCEPGYVGEINYSYVFKLLEDLGYDGYIGLEYFPKGDTIEGLKWLKEMNMTL